MPTETTELEVTYEDAERIDKAYGSLPYRGDAAVTVAVNTVLLSPHVKAAKIAREAVLKAHELPNLPMLKAAPDKLAAVVADLETARNKTVKISGLEPIKRSDLRLPDDVPAGMSADMAVLAQHGLLNLAAK